MPLRHLQDLGMQIERVWGFLSDGATAFKRMLETILGRARHFRCIFHLWRNILPFIATYKAKAGEEAAKLILLVCFARVQLVHASPLPAGQLLPPSGVAQVLGGIELAGGDHGSKVGDLQERPVGHKICPAGDDQAAVREDHDVEPV